MGYISLNEIQAGRATPLWLPWCGGVRMKKWFDAEDVRAARERIAGHIRQTPLEESIYLSDDDH